MILTIDQSWNQFGHMTINCYNSKQYTVLTTKRLDTLSDAAKEQSFSETEDEEELKKEH